MSMWTYDQNEAINKRGGKIIVSAAAGSGKTAVLSERVIKYVLDGGNINDLLIVTFTRAAAAEMKDRIKAKIEKALLNDSENKHLKRQLPLILVSKITTMDAFYSDIVKENFELLNISKDFDILTSKEENILKGEVLKNVFEESFSKVIDFEFLLSFFKDKDPSLIKDEVFKVSNFLGTIPNKKEFINKAIEYYDINNSFYKDKLFDIIKNKMNLYKYNYKNIIDELYNESDLFDNLIIDANKELNYINDIISINDFDTLSKRLRLIKFDTLKTPRGFKDNPILTKYKYIRNEFKDEINKNLYELSFITDDIYNSENKDFKRLVSTLLNIVNIYEDELLEKKKSINSYSFNDIAHFCLSLLIKDGKKTDLAINISKKYKEILVDECQDNNNIQDVIFKAISNNNSNIFSVGDVKQSIYRFRSACPEIFSKSKNETVKDGFPKLITLSKNFRSRKEVLDFCNFIFSNTMTYDFGEVNYDEKEKLYLGASYVPLDNLDTEVHIIDAKEKCEDEDKIITNAQKEAIYVANKIKSMLDSNYMVYDNKKGITRKIKESDIVILLRSLKNSSLYVKALNKRNISVYSSSSLTYFDNYEVKLVINLLKIIDNRRDDVSLLSILKSSLFNVSLDDIALIRNNKESLYDNILNSNNNDLKSILERLDYFRNLSHSISIYDLLSRLNNEFNIETIIGAMKNGIERQKNLFHMMSHAINFERKEEKSLHEFISYIESIMLNNDSFEGINPLSDGDNVLITTIHKSKGLEYPVVFLCETARSFNFSDVRNNFMINDELGICFPYKLDKYNVKYDSTVMMIFKEYEKSKLLSEELRVLYVALTRAKEKIIITGLTPNLETKINKISASIGDDAIISNLYLKDVKSYFDIMLACLLRHPSLNILRDISVCDIKTFQTESKVKVYITDAININEEEFSEKENINKKDFDTTILNKIDNFKYDNSLFSVPKVLSVSNIKENSSYFRKPNFMKDEVNYAKLGTLYHRLFEILPLEKYSIKTLEDKLDLMVKNKLLTTEERKLIKVDRVFSYLTSDIYDIIIKADKVFKEYEITFDMDAKYYDDKLSKASIITKGVVDLLVIKDDNYFIVDYKTDNINQDELIKRYKIQLDLYEMGIKQIFNAKNVKKYIYSIMLNKFIEV